MDKDFQNFLQSYLNGDFQELIKTKTGKMPFDTSTQEHTLQSIENLEAEILNTNINLLYAYHQWLKSQNLI